MDRLRRVGLPWYVPEQYEVLRTSLVDGGKLPLGYETSRCNRSRSCNARRLPVRARSAALAHASDACVF